MICVSSASKRYKRKKFSHEIDDKSARLFVDIVEHGGSIECVIEIMTGLTNTYANSSLDANKKSAAVQKLGNTPTGVGKTLLCQKTTCEAEKHPHGRGEDQKEFQEAHPALFEQFKRQSESRVLRLK